MEDVLKSCLIFVSRQCDEFERVSNNGKIELRLGAGRDATQAQGRGSSSVGQAGHGMTTASDALLFRLCGCTAEEVLRECEAEQREDEQQHEGGGACSNSRQKQTEQREAATERQHRLRENGAARDPAGPLRVGPRATPRSPLRCNACRGVAV
jgi:hypothetical protein